MLDTKVMEQVSDLMIQALSDESIKLAEPMTDVEIKLLDAVIDQSVNEGQLQEELSLVTGPKELIDMLTRKNLEHEEELKARKTLRRFYELYINLTADSHSRVLN